MNNHCLDISTVYRHILVYHWEDPVGGVGVRTPPPGKSQNLGFLSNTGPDHLKNPELLSQPSILGHYLHASKTPFKWRFAGGSMMAHLKWHLFGSSLPSKKRSQSWTTSDKTFWIRACFPNSVEAKSHHPSQTCIQSNEFLVPS